MMVFMGLSGDHGIFYRTIFLRVAEFGGEYPKKIGIISKFVSNSVF
jgi:hypothetical protein